MYVDFSNFMAVATATVNIQAILFDGQPITTIGSWIDIGDFSVIAGPVRAGFHSVTTVGGSSATFGGWVYGHSIDSESTSAYGYPITYSNKYCIISVTSFTRMFPVLSMHDCSNASFITMVVVNN